MSFSTYSVWAGAVQRVSAPAASQMLQQNANPRPLVGYLVEGSALRLGETLEALGDGRGARDVYERLSKTHTTAPDDVWMRLGRTSKAAGDNDKAIEAFTHVLYEFPFGDRAAEAASELEMLSARLAKKDPRAKMS